MKEFVVTRYAVRPDGTMTVPVSTHEEKTPALKDYLQKCAGQLLSKHPLFKDDDQGNISTKGPGFKGRVSFPGKGL